MLVRGVRHQTAAELSGFVQGVGFLIAANGPLLFGLLRQLTGSWNLSIVMVLVASGVTVFAVPRVEPANHGGR